MRSRSNALCDALTRGAAAAAFFFSCLPVAAHPDGAPWGSADPDTLHSCASCHFDQEPQGRSPALILAGLPEAAERGETYELTLRFDAAAAEAGFLVSASVGAFEAIDDFLEAQGGEIRSVKPASGEGPVSWRFRWRLNDAEEDIVSFLAAANASNSDQSAFGDQVHFRKFEILAPAKR